MILKCVGCKCTVERINNVLNPRCVGCKKKYQKEKNTEYCIRWRWKNIVDYNEYMNSYQKRTGYKCIKDYQKREKIKGDGLNRHLSYYAFQCRSILKTD